MNLFDLEGYNASRLGFHLMSEQSLTGIQFDQEGARSLLARCAEEMEAIRQEVEPQLPPRPLKKGEEHEYTIPLKPFKKDGTLSAIMVKWLAKHGLELIGVNYLQWEGELVKIEGGKLLPATAVMTLSNQDAIKDYLLQTGWSPSLWNIKKDARGKPVRDDKGKLIATSPKMQEQGRLCPNLERMQGPLVRQIVRWLSYRNRESTIRGWLENPRLAIDSRLSAGAAGVTNTHRQKHTCVVNLPKADPTVLLGTEVRSLFTARSGYVLVGWDATALEARVEGHYTFEFPGGDAYARTLIEADVHLETAIGVFGEHIGHLYGTEDWHKDHPVIKPWRSKAKNLRYASGYGAAPPKIASMLGVPLSEAESIVQLFWESAKPLSLLKEVVERFWEMEGGKKYIRGIDGRRVYTRSKHSLINALFQSCGAIAMDYSAMFMNKWLGGLVVGVDGTPGYLYKGHPVYRVAYQHDEFVYEAPPHLADEIGEMGVRSIQQAGKFLKLRVPLSGEYKVGDSWAAIH